MFKVLLSLYQSGEYQAVIDKYNTSRDVAERDGKQVCPVVAQSFYKLKRTREAGAMFFRAAVSGADADSKLLEIAFALAQKSEHTDVGMQAALKLLSMHPKHRDAETYLRHFLPYFASFEDIECMNERVRGELLADDPFSISCELPLDHIGWCAEEQLNAKIRNPECAPISAAARLARRTMAPRSGKIRVGYLSNDFSSSHATMTLFRGALESHDRHRFDIVLFCFTADELKQRDDGLRRAIPDIVEIGHLSDDEAADLIRSYQLDILVDLKGHTLGARVDLINSGLAPVHAAFLGFPGTGTGIDCDYVIGDHVVTPDSSKAFFHEKLCRLPETYQPNDNIHRALPLPMRRRDAGLPEEKIVFASFNAIRKVTPAVFRAWMRILASTSDSVLWLLCNCQTARQNILKQAVTYGVAGERIIFAEPIGLTAHIARLQAASIALDTSPYNGHTTTSDMLWAGLPVITLRGSNFASRVSESLLAAIGMGDLVADDLDDYVNLAIQLAENRSELAERRERLRLNRSRTPLFDTIRYVRHLERAYILMAERSRSGREPDHIDVPAIDQVSAYA